jgi:fructokinase
MTDLISLGVDFGGTKIEAAVICRPSGGAPLGDKAAVRVLARRRTPTQREQGYDAVLAATAELVRATAREAGVDPKTIPVGVGMPGSVTRKDGLVKNSNTECLNHRPFRQDLSRALGGKVSFENDANCFALAEALCGAGRRHGDGVVFGVIMGTGVGGGVVFRREVWGGPQGLGGEWGHHAVGPWRRPEDEGGEPIRGTALTERPPCSCGKLGCVELYASGSGVEREYQRRTGVARKMTELVERRTTDPEAGALIGELLEAFGRGLANVIDILDPSAIVLGGGLSNLDFLYTEGRARVQRYVFNDELRTPILRHELGDSAGVIGAALLDQVGASGA